MKKSKRIVLTKSIITVIIAVLIMLLTMQNYSTAATLTLGKLETMKYKINGNQLYDFNPNSTVYRNLYCLNGGAHRNSYDELTDGGSIYNLSDELIEKVFSTRERYNSFVWLVDNVYVDENVNATTTAVMLENMANIVKKQETVIEKNYEVELDENWINGMMQDYATRPSLIFTVQQALMWNYTNNLEANIGKITTSSITGSVNIPGDGKCTGNEPYSSVKYYMYIYTALLNEAENHKDYVSPNTAGMQEYANQLSLNSNSAAVDRENSAVGPFEIIGFNNKVSNLEKYAITVNGTVLADNQYTIKQEGNKIYIQLASGYFKADTEYTIDVNVNITLIATSSKFFYTTDMTTRQPIADIEKSVVAVNLPGKVVTTPTAEFDLHLSKNITDVYTPVNDNGITSYILKYTNQEGKTETAANLVSRKVQRVGNLATGAETDTYLTNKSAVTVAKGDLVRYKITVNNEGDIDGYAEKITDYIAAGLEVVNPADYGITEAINYNWQKEEFDNDAGITAYSTTYLSSTNNATANLMKAYDATTNTSDSREVYVYCKVTSTTSGKLLKNVAEITIDKAVGTDNKDFDDRDSTPSSITSEEIISKIDTWEGNDSNKSVSEMNDSSKYDIKGKQDDDDFENVKVEIFDLALTKEITSIGYLDGEEKTETPTTKRLIYYSTNTLKTSQTAKYLMNKPTLGVKTGAVVKYKITVYNEGDINGYATEITDYLPAGLEFITDSEINKNNGWTATKNSDGTTTIKTNKLKDRELKAYQGGDELDNDYVEVECTVTAETAGTVLTNVAEISQYGYYIGAEFIQAIADENKNPIVDRDSYENSIPESFENKTSVSEYIAEYEKRVNQQSTRAGLDKTNYDVEDDDDFEQIKIIDKQFDLALRKFISAVNGQNIVNGQNLTSYTETTTRIPNITDWSITMLNAFRTAEYYHGKEAIEVYPDDEVTYTIRVYNEGLAGDYNGRATEIIDYLPEGLQFVKLADDCKDFKAEELTDLNAVKLTYTGSQILKANSMAKLCNTIKSGNYTGIEEYYQEVKLVCKVTSAESEKILTNRAEITADQAYDLEDKEVEIDDIDSTPNSLLSEATTAEDKVNTLNLSDFYNDYSYGINDDHMTYYPGVEGDGTTDLKQDDIDFENVKVAKLSGEYSVQLQKIDGKNSNKKLEDVTFDVDTKINGTTGNVKLGPTDSNGLTQAITTKIENLDIDMYLIKEIDVGENEYVTLADEVALYVNKDVVDGTFRANQISFNQKNDEETTYTFGTPIKEFVKLTDGREVEISATLSSKGVISIIVPNLEEEKDFDLALKKIITGVKAEGEEEKEITDRYPTFKIDENENYVYDFATNKEPVIVETNNIVTYTLRVYNEGETYGYAAEIMDDIPEGLEFVTYTEGDGSVNDTYNWVMYREVEANETLATDAVTREYNEKTYVVTNDVTKADYIVTDYLSKENGSKMSTLQEMDPDTCLPYNPNLLKPFDSSTMKEPDSRDVKVQFKVVEPTTSSRIIINYAQITEDKDKYNEDVIDIDSTPNEWNEGEDDQDIEKIRVKYFDLALKKWVSKAIVIENGVEKVEETGHTGDENPEPVVKVDLAKSKLENVVVKFEYQIKVTNEGEIAGYVKEISDYIPQGLKFVAADNQNWTEADGKVVTDQLAGTLLQPGGSATVTILLTWINGTDNLGLKVNVAEISKDYNESGTPDIDSTPNNLVPGEDDIDDAPVILSVRTGYEITTTYIIIGIAVVAVLTTGVITIKKYVL